MANRLWYKVARTIVKAGNLPFPISDTLVELLQTIITENEAEFVSEVFKKQPNLNIDQIKENTELKQEEINELLENLMYKGVVSGTESRSEGIMVYRLQPPFPGLFEFQLMRPGESEKEKKLAQLFDKLFEEMSEGTQKNYDHIIPQYKNFPPVDRVVPVEEKVEVGQEVVLPQEEVQKIVDKYDDIALALCYCRHEKDLLGEPCEIDAPRKNCLLFGKTASFSIKHDFAEAISKEEAKTILKEAEDHGLVHKAFHIHQNPERDEEAICSCCSCCCGIFQMYYKGIMPLYTLSSYLAHTNDDKCIGCGTCVDMCPMEAIELVDTVASITEQRCIGCGVCAHHCSEGAMTLKRTGHREVFVPPPRIKTD